MAVKNRKVLKNDCLDYFINTRPRLLWAVGDSAIRSDGSKAGWHSDLRLLQTLSAYTHTHLFQQPGYTWGSGTLPGTFQETSSYIFFTELKSEGIILNHLHAIEHVGFHGVSGCYLIYWLSLLIYIFLLLLYSGQYHLYWKFLLLVMLILFFPPGLLSAALILMMIGVYVKGHMDFRNATLVS